MDYGEEGFEDDDEYLDDEDLQNKMTDYHM